MTMPKMSISEVTVGINASLQVCKCTSLQVCKYEKNVNIQICKYCMYVSIQVSKHTRMQLWYAWKYARSQKWKYASIHVCKQAHMKV